MLPDIHIDISDPPERYLARIQNLANDMGNYKTRWCHELYLGKGVRSLHLCLLSQSEHECPEAKLLIWPLEPQRIQVEMNAVRWKPDPPTRRIYCDLAATMIGTLIKADNATTGLRHRLHVQPIPRRRPPLPPKAAERFDRFVTLANRASLHPLDWGRFYDFVRISRREISEGTLTGLLVENGFNPARAEKIANIYHHLMAFRAGNINRY